MVKRVALCLLAVLFALSMAGMAIAADKAKGTITKVEGGGKSITVKTDSGEKTFSVSGSRTKFKGIDSRDQLKEGQEVSVTPADGNEGEAAQVSVQ